jgi:hypothetical protein
MKKIGIKDINKAENEFDAFVANEHTEFLCKLTASVLGVGAVLCYIIGEYSKYIIKNKED